MNKLPKSLRLENDVKSSKTKLKAFLFQKAYYEFINFLLFSIYQKLLTTVNIIIISYNFKHCK